MLERQGAACLAAAAMAVWAASPAGAQDFPAAPGLDAAPVAAGGPIAAPGGVLPATGTSVRVGDLRQQLATDLAGGTHATAPPNPDARRYTITPSLALTEEYTDNASGSGASGTGPAGTGQGGGRGDFITILQPGIAGTLDTPLLQGSLAYAPQVYLYARDSRQNRIGHDLDGRLLATLVPQTLFLDLRASGGLQSTNGLQGPATTTSQGRGQTTQTLSFSASPYALHRFGGWGTAELGANYSRTRQSGVDGLGTSQDQVALFQSQFANRAPLSSTANQDLTSYGGHAAFTTGEAFGRYNGTALAYATRDDGTGVLRGARRDTFTVDNGYAVTRTVTALAKLGWEDVRYAGTRPQRIQDIVWNVGVRLLPNDQSTVTLRYGHQDGLNSLLVDAAYQPTARTRVYLRYSSGLTTEGEQLQNALASSDVDSLGQPVDHTTGAPLIGADNFFGVQNDLYKLKQLTLTGVLLLDRDVISANLNGQDRRLISASGQVGTFAGASSLGSNKGIYGSLTWSHELRPDLQASLFAQYGVLSVEGPPKSNQRLFVGSASLSYALSDTLSGRAEYSYNQVSGDLAGTGSTENVVLVTVAKSF